MNNSQLEQYYEKESMYRRLWPQICENCLREYVYSCNICFSRHNKAIKRAKCSNPVPSKPLQCGNNTPYVFVFDKMIQPAMLRMYHLAGSKINKDRVYVRQHRKRQRRVNKFLIQEELNQM